MTDEKILEMAEQAWEQIEFDSGLKDLNIANYDAVRQAFIKGYTECARKNND